MMKYPLCVAIAALASAAPLKGATVTATNTSQARSAIAAAQSGDTILLAPGSYDNLSIENKTGITLRSQDPGNPAVIRPDQTTDLGIYIGNPSNVTVQDLVVDYTAHANATGNALHIDKAASPTFSSGLTLRNLRVIQTAPAGNIDGLHMSGVQNFLFENLRFENWGENGGGIDIVGAHHGVIRNSYFKGAHNDTGAGIQAKGGARNILIEANRFDSAGGRAMNIGGGTGIQFFEPGINFEAKDIVARGNVIRDGFTPVAFASSDGGTFQYNVSASSDRWLGRILDERTQQQKDAGFVPPRDGQVLDNVFIWQQGDLSSETVNASLTADLPSFVFAGNHYFNQSFPGNAAASTPNLPPGVIETGATYGVNPGIDIEEIVPWEFDWGLWAVNASLDEDAMSLTGFGALYLATPGEGAAFDPAAANPLLGAWTFSPAGDLLTLAAMTDAVLVNASLVPEPAAALFALAVPSLLLRPRRR